jgi:hypothetical protein
VDRIFFVQTAMVAAGRTPDHRAWGLAGIALFSVLLCTILVTEMAVLKRDAALGMGDAARRFAAVTLCAWPLMAGIFTLAIINVRRPFAATSTWLAIAQGFEKLAG